METTATSSNYFSVALEDDHARVEETPVLDKAAIRKQRIAAAVERSKTEYKEEHAYTERGHIKEGTGRETFQRAKIDRQQLEFLVSSLYYSQPPQYAEIISLILDAIDTTTKKTAGGLSRELLDTGLRTAVRSGDVEAGLRLARLSGDLWRGQAAGLAVAAAEAFIAGGLYADAVVPLLASISSYGLLEPVLLRLKQALEGIKTSIAVESEPNLGNDLERFQSIIGTALQRRRQKTWPPLFEDEPDQLDGPDVKALSLVDKEDQSSFANGDSIDVARLGRSLSLDEKTRADLAMTVRRLEKVVKGGDQEAEETEGRVERGVREL